MKQSVFDAEIVVRKTAVAIGLTEPFTFDAIGLQDVSAATLGNLAKQDEDFITFSTEVVNSRRAGPSRHCPTRYYSDLTIELWTKKLGFVGASRRLETIASSFYEKTIEGIRFRILTPMPPRKTNTTEGFTVYSGIIDFDYELFREG